MTARAPFRWESHRFAGAMVRAACWGGPLVAGVVVSLVVARTAPGSRLVAIVLATVAGTGAVLLVDRVMRRLLPLAALLELSLAFPDQAPSRLRVALRSGSPKRLLADRGGDAAKVLALAAGLTVHDRATRGHSERVRAYAELIADELRLPAGDHDRLRWAALLHDIGKVTVPASTLNAHHRLSDEEWDLLRHHPEEGARLTESLAPWLGDWARAVAEHHERFDGKGYPHGLAGEQLSLAGRIVCVADSYDAMTTDRSYSKAMLPGAARHQLVEQAGHQFDPDVVRAFLEVGIGRIRRIIGPVGLVAAAPLVRDLPSFGRHLRQTASVATIGLVSLVVVPTAGSAALATTAMPHGSAPAATTPATSAAVAGAPTGAGASVEAPTFVVARETASTGASPPAAPGRATPPIAPTLPCQLRVATLACVGVAVRPGPLSATAHAEAAGRSLTASAP